MLIRLFAVLFSALFAAAQSSVSLVGVYTIADPRDYVMKLEIRDTLAYVAAGYSGVRILDFKDPKNPYEVGYILTEDYTRDLAVSENYLVIADNTLYFCALDNPIHPTILGAMDAPSTTMFVYAHKNLVHAYCFDGEEMFVDASNPEFPIELHGEDTLKWYREAAKPETLYQASHKTLVITDKSDPLKPREIGSMNLEYGFTDGAVCGLNFYQFGRYGIRVIDVSNPAFPRVACTDSSYAESMPFGLFSLGTYALLSTFVNGIQVVSLEDPCHLKILATFDDKALTQKDEQLFRIVKIYKNLAYVVIKNELHIYDISGFQN